MSDYASPLFKPSQWLLTELRIVKDKVLRMAYKDLHDTHNFLRSLWSYCSFTPAALAAFLLLEHTRAFALAASYFWITSLVTYGSLSAPLILCSDLAHSIDPSIMNLFHVANCPSSPMTSAFPYPTQHFLLSIAPVPFYHTISLASVTVWLESELHESISLFLIYTLLYPKCLEEYLVQNRYSKNIQ